ncbi:MAG: HIT domain-containing protein [Desulfurococcus sp.]|nr:HIT domain-containing protein [Desulfurococcus sp.]
MEVLWNPWRYEYIKRFKDESISREECLFCRLKDMSDDEAYVVYRGRYSYIVLNAYPYNSGHVMIAPYEHAGSLEDLPDEVLLEMLQLVKLSMKAIRVAFNPDGFNIGVNVGRAAGAGVPGHVHIHVVPRWVGDTNFMSVISGVKTLPVSLRETYTLLKDAVVNVMSTSGGKDGFNKGSSDN